MDKTHLWYETIVMPALLRHARTTYGKAMRLALAEIGCEDIPKNGLYLIGGLALGGGETPLGELVKSLGVSKQAGGQLVDTLVVRGYLERTMDPGDRRKLTVALTARGRMAAEAQGRARDRIDAELTSRVGPEAVRHTRATLAALIMMDRETAQEPRDDA